MSIKSGLYGAVVGACATLIITGVVLTINNHRPDDRLTTEEYEAITLMSGRPVYKITSEGHLAVIMGTNDWRAEAMRLCSPTDPKDSNVIIASPHDHDFWTCVGYAESSLRYDRR